ncbi:PREDICTED: glucoside xylosyltransferase 1 isoform X2 [Papilio polytes]|uniref:glucoside xylosyltransferase 1 isoform X2 n=1 Tax=Papilio polytes TaxID=76194 RepID=UPI00067642C6|nr:PREDICTED: glucoside xylosyltransferase 1 isoform X2 [Papilio polytes]
MRRPPLCKLLITLCCCFIAIYLYILTTKENDNNFKDSVIPKRLRATSVKSPGRIVMSFVVCDSRFNESLNVIKSVLMFTKTPVHFVIFTDDKLRSLFKDTLGKWKSLVGDQLDFELQGIHFPEAHKEDWMNLFSKCAAQRLFIPISAMAAEDDNPNVSWYPRFAKHPFYGKYGLNSGVMLMNLTRMRSFGWVEYVTPVMLKWKLYIPWGDQDIINIIFHYHERAVRVLSCRYNYRSDQCTYGDACADATRRGVYVLHGSRGIFHNDKQPAFQAIYRAISEYDIGMDSSEVTKNMHKYLNEAPESNCGHVFDTLKHNF